MFLPITPSNKVPVDDAGRPVLLAEPASEPVFRVTKRPELWACGIDEQSAARLGTLVDALSLTAGGPGPVAGSSVTRALMLMRYRREHRYDALTGDELQYPGTGIVGRVAEKDERQLFPRLDPAVIGRIESEAGDAILLARNARRPRFFSLITGYVDAGETLEEAMAREAWEETGRRLDQVTYWGSQPWPPSGAIMVGFSAVTADVRAVGDTDGELEEIRWVTRAQLTELPLARAGSIAHRMIMEWYNRG